MGFVADTKAMLRASLDGWHEAALNLSDTPWEFPCWRVDFGGFERRGRRTLTVAKITVIVEFGQAGAVEEELETRAAQAIAAVDAWPKGIYRSSSGTELISLGSEAEYFGCTLRIEKT